MDETNLFECVVTDEYEGYRIDKLISELIDSFSRSYIKKLIDDKKVFCNDKNVKASYVVSENDVIKMEIPPLKLMSSIGKKSVIYLSSPLNETRPV